MKRIAALAAACAMLLAGLAVPALARTSYVQDGAGIFSSATISSLNAEIGNFSASTGKEVVVVTVPSLNGTALSAAAESAFAQQSVNGVLIFIAKAEHSDYIVGDRAAHQIFPAGAIAHVRDAMNASFRQGDFDGGVTNAVNLILDTYRSHPASGARSVPYGAPSVPAANPGTQGGLHVGFLWWILIIIAIFWVVRAVLRSAGGTARPGPGYGGPGYGGPGGYGYGGGFGGGGFWSGLLGGLGGAFLGNELFGQHNQNTIGTAGTFGEPGAANTDSGAYQPDAGQPDMGGASGGNWGDAGGGWGGGDAGGGGWGGGDAGGGGWGGGDSGGGGW